MCRFGKCRSYDANMNMTTDTVRHAIERSQSDYKVALIADIWCVLDPSATDTKLRLFPRHIIQFAASLIISRRP